LEGGEKICREWEQLAAAHRSLFLKFQKPDPLPDIWMQGEEEVGMTNDIPELILHLCNHYAQQKLGDIQAQILTKLEEKGVAQEVMQHEEAAAERGEQLRRRERRKNRSPHSSLESSTGRKY
jgi:hypothetical protein